MIFSYSGPSGVLGSDGKLNNVEDSANSEGSIFPDYLS